MSEGREYTKNLAQPGDWVVGVVTRPVVVIGPTYDEHGLPSHTTEELQAIAARYRKQRDSTRRNRLTREADRE